MKPSAILAFLVVGTMPSVATAQSFAAKPGAWEMTTTMSGNVVAPETLAKMSPERRALVEQRMTAGTGPRSRKVCVRQADLEQDRFLQSQSADCKVRTVSRSATSVSRC